MMYFQKVAAGLILLVTAVAAHAASNDKRPEIMPVSEIRPGMKGYGLTVFQGTEPERFEAEIIGVMESGIGARVDMILARLDHPRLEDIGIIAGMSGSPVYINDRLIGAVAYGFTWSKAPIAGVTPIEKMLEVYSQTEMEPPPRDIALGPVEQLEVGQPVSLVPKLQTFGAEPIRIHAGDLPESVRAAFEPGVEELEMQPLKTPLMVSSCSPQTAKVIEDFFTPLGMEPIFVPLGAASGAAESSEKVKLQNGSAMGIPYLLGDLSMGVTGTATYVRGEKLVAFGHPMSGRGPVAFPLGQARGFTHIPSRQRPVKLTELINVIGGVHQDRQAAIGAVVGKIPYMIPLKVRVINEAEETEHEYNFKIIDHRLYTPRIAMIATLESCTAGDRVQGDMTMSASYKIDVDDGSTIEKEIMSAGSGAVQSIGTMLMSDLAPIYSNTYDIRSVRKLEAEVHIRNRIEAATIRSAYVDRSIYKPGQEVHISTYVKPFRKPQVRLTTTIRLPAELEDGRYNVVVCDSSTRESVEVARAPGLYKPREFADIVRILQIHFMPNRLYVLVTKPERGITIDGQEFTSLPPVLLHTVAGLQDQELITPTLGQNIVDDSREMPYLVQGGEVIPIQVDRHGGR